MDTATSRRLCASACGRSLRPSNQTGLCEFCVRRHRCRVCKNVLIDPLHHWACADCRRAYRQFFTAMRRFFPRVRLEAQAMELRVAVYRQMVAENKALFANEQAS